MTKLLIIGAPNGAGETTAERRVAQRVASGGHNIQQRLSIVVLNAALITC